MSKCCQLAEGESLSYEEKQVAWEKSAAQACSESFPFPSLAVFNLSCPLVWNYFFDGLKFGSVRATKLGNVWSDCKWFGIYKLTMRAGWLGRGLRLTDASNCMWFHSIMFKDLHGEWWPFPSFAVYLWKTCRICFYHECLCCRLASQPKSRVLRWGKVTLLLTFVKHWGCVSFLLFTSFPWIFLHFQPLNVLLQENSIREPRATACLVPCGDSGRLSGPQTKGALVWESSIGNTPDWTWDSSPSFGNNWLHDVEHVTSPVWVSHFLSFKKFGRDILKALLALPVCGCVGVRRLPVREVLQET